jgi:hypothetical protein
MTPAPGTPAALDRYRTITAHGVDMHVDKFGWPVETCGRCDGSGRYSYCQMHGDRCFGCQGAGVVRAAGKVQDIYAEFHAAADVQRKRTGSTMAVGDEVRDYHAPKGTPFRRVVAVAPTGRECGRPKIGSEDWKIQYTQMITFEDGETIEAGNVLWAGRVTVKRAPYVERAQQAHAVKVKRRVSAAARRASKPPAPPKPRSAKPNQFPGQCTACQAEVPAGAGIWTRDTGVRHTEGQCTS